jgi:hypothetical protein
MAEESELVRAGEHLINDNDYHEEHVDSQRPEEEFLEPSQVPAGNRFLLESG